MIKAYDLESKYAIYPRVVVHQDVIVGQSVFITLDMPE